MVFSNRYSRTLPAALAVLAFLLAGCLFDSGNGSAGSSLSEGHYSLLRRFDQSYAYKAYFVVLPDAGFEWVEYGYNASNNQVCKVTRKRGSFTFSDSSLAATVSDETAPATGCGFSESDFKAMKWTTRSSPQVFTSPVRNLTDSSFEAKAFFGASTDWKVHEREADPYGFYE